MENTITLVSSAAMLSLIFAITDPRMTDWFLTAGKQKRAQTRKGKRSSRQ
ncbi:hypothetical protein [Armatimonas rosea]|uniref:Uncharacterized protein n=1 Tax=Armatimonas rosea TaxID=685828 RepID=A0A7W9SX58_ARMRO|nr:hypothetical protein [Armatimonas rosea]MBB6053859.1 hypothetical protein [Armatimonas rosea]